MAFLVCLRLWNISNKFKEYQRQIAKNPELPWTFVFHLGVLLRFLWHQRPRFDGSHADERHSAPEGTHEVRAQGATGLVNPSPTPQKDAEFGNISSLTFRSTLGLLFGVM